VYSLVWKFARASTGQDASLTDIYNDRTTQYLLGPAVSSNFFPIRPRDRDASVWIGQDNMVQVMDSYSDFKPENIFVSAEFNRQER
jgi:hypothetical protein